MRAKFLYLIPLLFLFSLSSGVQAQIYLTQPITGQNATALIPLIAFDHTTQLDAPYPVTPTPTASYTRSERNSFDPHFIFSPDERYLAHIIDEPLVLWLVDLVEGTERAFPLDGVDLSISRDWHTLAVIEPGDETLSMRTRLWDMDSLLALPRAPIGETASGTCQFRIIISSTNLRQSPNTQAASMGYALADQTYIVVATNLAGDWVQIRGEMQPAWVGSQYGTLEGDCDALPVRLIAGGERAVLDNRMISFSPDSQFIISRGQNGYGSLTEISVYNASSGELLYELNLTQGFLLSPDSRLLVDGTGQFFELATGNRLYSSPTDIRLFSPDSSKIALVGTDGIVRLLDTETGEELRTFTLPRQRLDNLFFSPDGRYLYIMVSDPSPEHTESSTFLWDLTSSQTNVLPTQHSDAYIELSEFIGNSLIDTFLSDGSAIVQLGSATDPTGVWDIAAREFRFVIDPPEGYYGGAIPTSSDDNLIFVDNRLNEHNALTFLSAQTGDTLSSVIVPYFMEFSPNWHWIVSQDMSNGVTLWGVPANADVPTLPPTVTRTPTPSITPPPPGFVPTPFVVGSLPPYPYHTYFDATIAAQALTLALTPSLTFTPSVTPLPTATPFIVTPQPGAEAITAANYEQVTLLHTIQLLSGGRAFYNFAELTPDGSRLVIAVGTSLGVWDVISGEQIMTIDEHPTFIIGMDVSEDGQYVLTLADDAMLRLWSLSNGALVNSVPLEGRTYSNIGIHLSPDNRRALVPEYNAETRNHLRVRELETGAITFDQPFDRLTGVGFRSDGVPVWWTTEGIYSSQIVQTTPYVSNRMYGLHEDSNVASSADLTRLATFDNQSVNIHIWDTAGRHDPLLLQGHTARVREAYFSPDRRLLVSSDWNGEMLMWDTLSGNNLTTIPEGILPNGMNVGSGRWLLRAEDGAPLVWNISSSLESLVVDVGSNLSMGADGATIAAANGGITLLFGIPTAERPAYGSVPGRVLPSAINVRPQPSLDVEASGTVAQGVVIIAGRDASGQFVYLPNVNGWALADPAYIDLGGLLVEELPIRNS